MAEHNLAGKVAIVTGAGSPIGLGHAMAAGLVQAGARVALLDIHPTWLEESAEDIRSIGGEASALPIVTDITNPSAVTRAVAQTIEELGKIDILFNNAGLLQPMSFWDVTPEAWRTICAVNLDGPFYMASVVVGHMKSQGWGRIIGVTTSLGSMWSKGNATYGASKAGHEALISVMAQELDGSGVTANVLVPGGNTYTNMTASEVRPDLTKDDMIRAEIMQAPAVWLASEGSSDFTGQRIVAYHWDESLPLAERLEKASAPAAWPQLGGHAIRRGGRRD